jgi:hypothetical protein
MTGGEVSGLGTRLMQWLLHCHDLKKTQLDDYGKKSFLYASNTLIMIFIYL